MKLVLLTAIVIVGLQQVEYACQLPLNPGIWYSSTKGNWEIPENRTSLSGYLAWLRYTASETLYCIQQEGDNRYILGTDFEIFFGSFISVYTCLEFKPITNEISFTYTIRTLVDDTTGVHFTSNITNVCNADESKSSVEGTHVVIKHGAHSEAVVKLPDLVLGKFDLTLKDDQNPDNSTYGITFDTCTNKSIMLFNSSRQVDDNIWFADSGNLASVYVTTMGDIAYIHTFDGNASQASPKFLCWVFSKNGHTVHGTVRPNECHPGQTSSSIDSPGLTFLLVPHYTCGQTIVPKDNTLTTPLAVILGSCAGGLVLVATTVAVIFARRRCVASNVKYKAKDEEAAKEPGKGACEKELESEKKEAVFPNEAIHQSLEEVMNGEH